MPEPSRDFHITINSGSIIRFFAAAVFLWALYYMSDVLVVVIAAIVIASAVEPVIRRFKRVRVHRIIAVIIIYIIIAAVLAAILIFFLPMVVTDITTFIGNLPANVSLEKLWSPIRDISMSFGTTSPVGNLSSHTLSISDFVKGLQSLFIGTSAGAFQTASVLFGGVLSFMLIIVLSFYLAVKEDGVDDFLRIVTPVKHHDYIIDLWKRSQRKIGFWLQGQILLGLIIGVLVYVVLIIVGIPHALLLALLAGLLEIIPVFGPIISAVPAVLVAFADRGVGTGFLLMGLYLIIHQFENNLIYPLVVKKVVGISPIVVILALVIGAKLAGILGALLAVPLSAAFMEYVHDIEKYKKLERAERESAKSS